MSKCESSDTRRLSGVELLKIISIFLVVIYHVSASVGSTPKILTEFSDKMFNLNIATDNVQLLILGLFNHFGVLGNDIFFVCSFWFLCDSRGFKFTKILTMLMDVWIISIIFLLVYLNIESEIPFKLIIKSLFPTTFQNNWFITCYLLIYALHPFLNIIVEQINKRIHVTLCLFSVILYSGIALIDSELMFGSLLIHAIVLYILVAYMKKYMHAFAVNVKVNVIMFLVGCFCVIGLYLLTNYLGTLYSVLANNALLWAVNNNPFIIMISIAVFNIFGQFRFKNKIINYLSSLSMLIYVIHNNILFRSYTSVRIWANIVETQGYSNILFAVIVFSVILLGVATVLSILYKSTIHKFIKYIEKCFEPLLVNVINNITNKLMKIV